MKKQIVILLSFTLTTFFAISQVSSTNGTFTAAGTTNFSMRTNTAPRITVLGSGVNIGFVGINTITPAYNLDVNGNINASSFLVNGKPLWTTDGSTISYTGSIAGDVNLNLAAFTSGNSVLTLTANTGGASILRAIRSGGIASPLILQTNSLERVRIDESGNVGIGTATPDTKLTVKGIVHATEVRVDLNVPGPDYVFEPIYDLKPLAEIEAYIKENKHLPEIPSAKEMEKNGINVGVMNMMLLKKIEELTLHIITQQNKLKEQEERINVLEKRNK
jgi:hypothetical protein